MINDLQSFYSIGDCPKCGNRNRSMVYVSESEGYHTNDRDIIGTLVIPEHIVWTCKSCGFVEKSKTLDDSK